MKATSLAIWSHKEDLQRNREDGYTYKQSYNQRKRDTLKGIAVAKRQLKLNKKFGRSYDITGIRILEAKKNYRCCGYNCPKIIAKGTKHFSTQPKYPMDLWWKACSLKCAINADPIQDSNDYVLLRITSKHKLAKDVVDPTIRRRKK